MVAIWNNLFSVGTQNICAINREGLSLCWGEENDVLFQMPVDTLQRIELNSMRK